MDENDLDEGTIHDVLRNERRRLVIKSLRKNDGSANVRELAEWIAARETGSDPPPTKKRQSVYVSLHQTHLPKLNDLDIASYDPDDREVKLQDHVEAVEVYMEVVPEYGLSWGEFYFGWGLLGVLVTIGTQIGVPFLSAISPSMIATVLFVGLVVASAFHVYTQQDRFVFQRLLQ